MENLIEDESLNNSDESSDSINIENTNDLYWKINFKKELLFWETIVLQSLVYHPIIQLYVQNVNILLIKNIKNKVMIY